ncbi:DUF4179 domain-containing protein [Bacillus sp. SM2101]|uniref:DUF4179 domain-containing protein n=1 Tax=Bacillus sp. SM2101 TaxID=2805366 RepID=UPI001BDF2BA4|nr:DUF4179 domain-containing protein [Bacillus sp. SM2101]
MKDKWSYPEKVNQMRFKDVNQQMVLNQLDVNPKNGLYKAQKRKKVRRRFYISTVVSSLIILIFISSIRISPTFAMYVTNIPGLSKVVQIINNDKGIKAAINNNYIQTIGAYDENNGDIFTIEHAILDEKKLILFYTIECKENNKPHYIEYPELYSINGEKIDLVLSEWNRPLNNNLIRIDLSLNEELPENLILKVPFQSNENQSIARYKYEIPFSINKKLFSAVEQTIKINKTIDIDGQRVYFNYLTINPTHSELKVSFDDKNNKEILGFENLRLTDQDGNNWFNNKSGPMSYNMINNGIIRFESSYFYKLEELYIEFSGIRAVDKDSLDVVIDLENETIIKAPDDKLSLQSVSGSYKKGKDPVSLEFKMIPYSDAKVTDLNVEFYDADGQHYLSSGQSGKGRDGTWRIDLNPGDYISPLTFKLADYPIRINKDVRLKIK